MSRRCRLARRLLRRQARHMSVSRCWHRPQFLSAAPRPGGNCRPRAPPRYVPAHHRGTSSAPSLTPVAAIGGHRKSEAKPCQSALSGRSAQPMTERDSSDRSPRGLDTQRRRSQRPPCCSGGRRLRRASRGPDAVLASATEGLRRTAGAARRRGPRPPGAPPQAKPLSCLAARLLGGGWLVGGVGRWAS